MSDTTETKTLRVEDLQAEVDQLRVMVFAHSYPASEVIKRVTRAIGKSIDGFAFEISEASYGTPARINVLGRTDDGKQWSVDLAITRIDEVEDDDDWDDEEAETDG